jgi:hypothetical protein
MLLEVGFEDHLCERELVDGVSKVNYQTPKSAAAEPGI